MWFLGKRAKREKYLSAWEHGKVKVKPPIDGEIPTSYIAIPEKDLPDLAAGFVAAMETQRTNAWCHCQWLVHPEDVDKPEGSRRLRRGLPADDCPVHTKEGFLLYFFDWIFTYDK